MSIRSEQIASTLRRAVQTVIARGINDPRVRGLVSVTRVDVAPDLSEARVSVSVHPAEHARLTLSGLRQASKKIRTEVSQSVRLRKMPKLVFDLDESIKKLAAIEQAIASGRRSDVEPDDRQAEGGDT